MELFQTAIKREETVHFPSLKICLLSVPEWERERMQPWNMEM